MVSDDELERRIETFERDGPRAGGVATAARMDRLEANARDVHEELARRIEAARDSAATDDDLSELTARVEAIERRLAALEEQS